jgi:CRISPR-associated endonuclease Csn1
MEQAMKEDMILGIDLGANSIGWALLKCDPISKDVTGLVDAGSRIFEAGMTGDISSGRAESRCVERRNARSVRRNLERRRKRMTTLKNLLQEYGLLPDGESIESIVHDLDMQVKDFIKTIPESHRPENRVLAHTYPYFLRALASIQEIPPHLLGRAIYHLAQRRGFQSNRKTQTDEKELGLVKQGIADLRSRMSETGAKTLGQYFAFVDPSEIRIRGRWTSREMYESEFRLIMGNNPCNLSSSQIKKVEKTIFFQRKLRSQKTLIGECALEKSKRRCPWYRREAQEFRYLQSVNNLKLITIDGELRSLYPEERTVLLDILSGATFQLDKRGDLTLAKAKKALGLPAKTKFTIEDGGEKVLKGDRTTARMVSILGEAWNGFNPEKQASLIQDMSCFEKSEPLKKRLVSHHGISLDMSELLADTTLEPGYCNLSANAIRKLLPLMREGKAYSEAVKEVYPAVFSSTGIVNEFLPSLKNYTKSLRNPVVERCLNELRRVINAVIREYGKPGIIRLELARDVKNTKKVKERMIQENRDREKERHYALNKILEEFSEFNASRDDITKILLAEECGYICPYTGESISISSLIGRNPRFDIEHIIPRSRSMDNSFINKTLCLHEENRNVKKNRTPYEAYHGTAKYDEILGRVSRFKGKLAKRKLELFQMTPDDVTSKYEDFSNRQLNDTRYASLEASAYLGLLYGGVNTSIDGKRRVNVLSGGVTSMVRAFHGLNAILNDGGEKTRKDHRHHAVDAIAIGVTSPGMVKHLSDSIRIQETMGAVTHYRTESVLKMDSWPSMLEDSRHKIAEILASHHVSKRISGALHEATFYSKDHHATINGKVQTFKHIPVELPNLERGKVPFIVDDGVRRAVETKLEQLQIDDPKKAFRNLENLPELISSDGETRIPIKKVKIRRTQNTITVGKGNRQRSVVSGNNHHMLIYAELDDADNEVKWVGEVVTLLEAKERQRRNQPVVNRDLGPGKKFKMTIQCGDVFKMVVGEKRELVIVRTIPQSKQICFARVNDSRLVKDIKSSGDWLSKMPDTLRVSNPTKYTVDPLGRLRRAND